MPITGLSFLLFALAAVVLYYLFPERLRQYVLLAASILFYLTYGVRMAGYLAATILLTYLFGLWLDRLAAFRPAAETKEERKRQKRANDRKKRRVLALSLVLNFASLALLKYGGFLAAAVNSVLGTELPLPGESETEYIDAVRNDAAHEAETFAAFGIPKPDVIAFPEGAHTTLTDVVLRECGYKVTLTTDESRVNTVVVGLPQTLIDLGRMTVLPGMTDEQLLQYLNERAN